MTRQIKTHECATLREAADIIQAATVVGLHSFELEYREEMPGFDNIIQREGWVLTIVLFDDGSLDRSTEAREGEDG